MDEWSFGKEISLTFLGLMLLQIIGFVVWLTRLASRVGEIESDLLRASNALEAIPKQIPPREVFDRLTEIETNQTFIIGSLHQIAVRLDVTLIPTEIEGK